MPRPSALDRVRHRVRLRYGGAHLSQPEWFARYAVDAEDGVPGSTLELYRRALALRHELQTAEELAWTDGSSDDVVGFERPGGWVVVTNFGAEPVALPAGEVLVSSRALEGDELPAETTVWLRRA